MNRLLPCLALPLALSLGVACHKDDSAADTARVTGATVPAAPATAADNTAANARDNRGTLTPLDQSNREGDLATTQEIRKALIASDSLSSDAKNVKIITEDGTVTLRGVVQSDAERATVELMSRKAAETDRVVNEIEVESK